MEANLHKGHRARMKQRFFEHGLDNFADHQVLELLLFFAIPQRDVNPLAHQLLNQFGSLAAVLDAPAEELRKIPGAGENVVALLKLIPQVSRRYLMSRTSNETVLDSVEKAGTYLMPYFFAQREEVVYLICMDAKRKVLSCQKIFQGSVHSAEISIRKILEAAFLSNATSVILAHNHPSGMTMPSKEDFQVTQNLYNILRSADIELSDHFIIVDNNYISMLEFGALDRY